MNKIQTVVVGNGAYNAEEIASMSWEQFKTHADAATEATKTKKDPTGTAYFGLWGDQRETKLREVYDASVEKLAKHKEIATDTSGVPAPGTGVGDPGKAFGTKTPTTKK